jgi:predicted lipoprotein DUF2380
MSDEGLPPSLICITCGLAPAKMGMNCNGCYNWAGEGPGDDVSVPLDLPGTDDDLGTDTGNVDDPGPDPDPDPDPVGSDDGSDGNGRVEVLGDEFSDDHHIFPQAFGPWFAARGIDIHDYCVPMLDGFHSLLHSAGWNQEWQHFKENNPNATSDQVEKFAVRLMDSWGMIDDDDFQLRRWKRRP